MYMTEKKAQKMMDSIISKRGFEDEFTIHFIRCIENLSFIGIEKFRVEDVHKLYTMCLLGLYSENQINKEVCILWI